MDQEPQENIPPGKQENVVVEVQQVGDREEEIMRKIRSEKEIEDSQEIDVERTKSDIDHLMLIPPQGGGDELNYKKTVLFCSENFDSDEDYHNPTKTCEAKIESNQNARTSTGEKEAKFNHSGENDISAILCCEVVEEILMCAVQSSSRPETGTGLAEAANQQSNCRENDSSGEHLIDTADGLSPALSAGRSIVDRQSDLEPDMTQDCPTTKTAGLLDWLQAKETEVNAILEEVTHCQSQHEESEQELQNLLEELADIDGLKSEFQVEDLNELTENILKAPDCFMADETTADSSPNTEKILPTSIKSKPEKNRKSKSAVKSPLLRRKEIKTCLNLHRACEDSEVLQELLIPAVRFGNSENYLEDSEETTSTDAQFITESIDDNDLVDYDTNDIARHSVRPGLLTIAIFHLINYYSNFSRCQARLEEAGCPGFPGRLPPSFCSSRLRPSSRPTWREPGGGSTTQTSGSSCLTLASTTE